MTQSRGRARIGLLVPFTNSNLEPDMALLCPQGASLHAARLGGYDEDEIPDADQMHGLGASDLDEPLRLLMGVRPDVVIYGCTSATLTHGPVFDRDLANRIKQISGAATVTAAGSIVHALRHLNIARIGFASPYVPGINDMAVEYLSQMGVDAVARAEIDETLDNQGQGALSPDAVLALGQRADHADAEAIVLSCTDMRSVEIIDRLEDKIGKPVITSNQAMMFETLQFLGIDAPMPGFGQLLSMPRL